MAKKEPIYNKMEVETSLNLYVAVPCLISIKRSLYLRPVVYWFLLTVIINFAITVNHRSF